MHNQLQTDRVATTTVTNLIPLDGDVGTHHLANELNST